MTKKLLEIKFIKNKNSEKQNTQMQKNIDVNVNPLKKVGFQKKKGANPHLVKIENKRTYHVTPNKETKSVVVDAKI